jgi:hypothetical protein
LGTFLAPVFRRAGSGQGLEAGYLFVKFGAMRPGAGANARFAALLDACAAQARSVGMETVLAGVNLSREEAYRQMLTRGFRSRWNVITMHRPKRGVLQPPRPLCPRRLAVAAAQASHTRRSSASHGDRERV